MGLAHLHSSAQRSVLPRKGRRRLRGYRTYVDSAGLIHIVPRAQRGAFRLPLFPIVVLISLSVVFKALAMMNIGINDYSAQVAEMQSGGAAQQTMAILLRVDPASMWVYQMLQPFFL